MGVLLIFALAISITLFVVIKTNFLERKVNDLLKRNLEKKYDLKIELGDIGGSVFSGFHISDIVVEYGKGENRYRLATVKYLDVDYSISDLIRGDWHLQSLLIDSLSIKTRRKPDGSMDIPQFGGRVGGGSESPVINFSVESFILLNSDITLAGEYEPLVIDSLNFMSRVSKYEKRVQAEINSILCRIPSEGLAVRGCSGTMTFVDSLIAIEGFRLSTDSSLVLLDADLLIGSDTTFTSSIDTSMVCLSEVSRLAGGNVSGLLSVSGSVEGSLSRIGADLSISGNFKNWLFDNISAEMVIEDGLITVNSIKGGAFGGQVNGTGEIDVSQSPQTYSYLGEVSEFDLSETVKGSFETNFSGQIELDGKGFSTKALVLDLDCDLGWGRFDAYTADSLNGRCRITSDSIYFAYPFDIFYKSTSVSAGGSIEYSGDMDIEGEADLAVIEEFRNQIFLKEIGGRGVARFNVTGPTRDPDVTGSFNSDSAVVYDLESSDFFALIDIQKFFTEPRGNAEVYSGEFQYGGLPGTALASYMRIEPDFVWIDRFSSDVPPFHIEGDGHLEIAEDTILLRMHNLSALIDAETISLDREGVVSFNDTGINVIKLEFSDGTGSGTTQGSYLYDGSLDFGFSFDSVEVATWLPHFYDDYLFKGYLAGQGTLGGDLLEPEFEIDVNISNVLFEEEPMGELTGSVRFADSLLIFSDVVMEGTGNKYSMKGALPMDLAFEEREERMLSDDSLSIVIAVSGTDFSLLEVFFEDVEWTTGEFEIDLSASGTPENPVFDGSVMVENGRCKVYYIENVLEKVSLTGNFDGQNLTINEATGELRRGDKSGQFKVAGLIGLKEITKPDYYLTVSGENLPVKYDIGEIEALIENLDLVVEGSDPPVVTGDIDLMQFLYQEPFFEDVEYDALEAADTVESFDYNIRISVPQNMWIKNEDADVELKGDLIVLKEGKLENFLGTLETMRGKFYLTNFNRTFTISPGGTITFDNIEEFNPHLDIEMTTSIRDSTGMKSVCMRLTRTLTDPNIDVCEGSDMAIEEVMVFMNPIGGGYVEQTPGDTVGSGGGQSLGNRVTIGATGIALGQASRFISRKLGVETFELNTSNVGRSFNPLETELTIGFYTTPRLYIYGTSQLTFGKTEELGFDYRLSRWIFISGHRDRNNLYKLNLNLNWEFE